MAGPRKLGAATQSKPKVLARGEKQECRAGLLLLVRSRQLRRQWSAFARFERRAGARSPHDLRTSQYRLDHPVESSPVARLCGGRLAQLIARAPVSPRRA
jgi:hypothetical protein